MGIENKGVMGSEEGDLSIYKDKGEKGNFWFSVDCTECGHGKIVEGLDRAGMVRGIRNWVHCHGSHNVSMSCGKVKIVEKKLLTR